MTLRLTASREMRRFQREKELLAVAMEAKEELSTAQEAAAAAAAHAAHYKVGLKEGCPGERPRGGLREVTAARTTLVHAAA